MMKNLTATTTCILLLIVLISCADSGNRQGSDTTGPDEPQISAADSGRSFGNLTILSETTGRATTIGEEKTQNSNITPDKAIQK